MEPLAEPLAQRGLDSANLHGVMTFIADYHDAGAPSGALASRTRSAR